MDNFLQGQKMLNGYLVNEEEKPAYAELSTNMNLNTSIEVAQKDYAGKEDKLYNLNSGVPTSLPKTEFIEVKENLNGLTNSLTEPQIRDTQNEMIDEYRRINLQIQNRLNERNENQLDTAFAPQGLSRNEVQALSASRPKLQKELEAIAEYARTHFITPEETKKLKEDLIKKNYEEWTNKIEQVTT
jgi:hypothetical protein